jgi:hypothetical protein
MKRATTIPSLLGGPTCEALRPKYRSMEEFLKYKDSDLNKSEVEVYVGGLLASDLQGGGAPEAQAAASQRVNENLSRLQILEQKTATMTKCIQQDIIQKQNYSGRIYDLQMEIEDKQKTVNEMETTSQEAKERADLLNKPYSKTTRWEGWFPLGRPLQENSLPVLLSFALFFLVLALGMFLRMLSIQLKMEWFQIPGSGVLSGYGIGR